MKFIVNLLILVFAIHATSMAQTTTRIVCDDTCKTESGATAVKGDGFAVVSPVGRGTVKMIEMVPTSWLYGGGSRVSFIAAQPDDCFIARHRGLKARRHRTPQV